MPPSRRIDHIDSIRAIAVLLVLWTHVTEKFVKIPAVAAHGTWMYDLQARCDFGRIGVVAFFAISGFVIPPTLRGEKWPAIRRFAVRRLFRLYPAYWLSIPLGWLAIYAIWHHPLGVGTVIANLSMVSRVFGYPYVMGHYWTLETELAFYLACTILFAFGVLHRPQTPAVMIAAFLGVFALMTIGLLPTPEWPQWQGLPYHLAIMFWGTLFRYWYDNRDDHIRFRRWKVPTRTAVILGGALLMLPVLAALAVWIHGHKPKPLRQAISYSLGIALFTLTATVLRIRMRFMVWLGAISYSFYLFHPVMFYPLLLWATTHPNSWWHHQPLAVYVLATTLISMGFGALIYYCLERPVNGFAHRITAVPQSTERYTSATIPVTRS